MVLGGSNIFGNERDEIFKKREFTKGERRTNTLIVALAKAGTLAVVLQSIGLGINKVDYGWEADYSILNSTGASRDITIKVLNNTRATTLVSESTTIGGVQGRTGQFFFTLEEMSEGDQIEFEVGDEGIGTAVDANLHGYIEFSIRGVFLGEDEEE